METARAPVFPPSDDTPEDLVRARLLAFDASAVAPLVGRLRALARGRAAAVVLYGSRLAPELATPTSVHDFFVLVDDYRAALPGTRDRLLARVLPPNVYRLRVAGPDGATLEGKYCVISRGDLERETSCRARDFYHLGRFSKRMAVVWRRDDETLATVVRAAVAATRALAPHALAALPERFSLADFSRALLAMSYRGEVRPESGEKVDRLLRAEAEYYAGLHRAVLDERARERPGELAPGSGGSTWSQRRSPARTRATRRAIARSRRRSVLRWPKQMWLFDGWLDFLLAKVQRTWGVDVRAEMTGRELRHPLLFGWRRFFRLVRQGKIR